MAENISIVTVVRWMIPHDVKRPIDIQPIVDRRDLKNMKKF
jgi:hypothetical protein